jgi:AcrR family transcriptional regulator
MGRKSVVNERKDQVFKALHSCLQTKSFKEISTRELANIAEINHGLLYYFFKDKKDILLQYIDYLFEIYEERFMQWLNIDSGKKPIDEKRLKEMYGFMISSMTLDKEFSTIGLEVWSLSRRDEDVKAKLKRNYENWSTIIVSFLTGYGLDADAAKKMSSSIIALSEGATVFLVLFEKDEKKLKEMLHWFVDEILDQIKSLKKRKNEVKQSIKRRGDLL